jgi:hypothetical protein
MEESHLRLAGLFVGLRGMPCQSHKLVVMSSLWVPELEVNPLLRRFRLQVLVLLLVNLCDQRFVITRYLEELLSP